MLKPATIAGTTYSLTFSNYVNIAGFKGWIGVNVRSTDELPNEEIDIVDSE